MDGISVMNCDAVFEKNNFKKFTFVFCFYFVCSDYYPQGAEKYLKILVQIS